MCHARLRVPVSRRHARRAANRVTELPQPRCNPPGPPRQTTVATHVWVSPLAAAAGRKSYRRSGAVGALTCDVAGQRRPCGRPASRNQGADQPAAATAPSRRRIASARTAIQVPGVGGGVGEAVAVALADGDGLGVALGSGVGVRLAVAVRLAVGDAVVVAVRVRTAVRVAVPVRVGVMLRVGELVRVGVRVAVPVRLGVSVGGEIGVPVGVGDGLGGYA